MLNQVILVGNIIRPMKKNGPDDYTVLIQCNNQQLLIHFKEEFATQIRQHLNVSTTIGVKAHLEKPKFNTIIIGEKVTFINTKKGGKL